MIKLDCTIGTEIMDKAKEFQEGRVPKDGTIVPFNFTEGWFRNSGIYELQPERQEQFMNWFLDGKQKGKTQQQIGESIGWSRTAVLNYCRMQNNIDTTFLEKAKMCQTGRVSNDDTSVSFNFTEGWFRNSGIYELQPLNPLIQSNE